jgi:predicted nucleic acid-binding protein
VDEALLVDTDEVERAKAIRLAADRLLSARDSLPLAVMQHHGTDRILSFGSGLDDVPGISRMGGAAV